MKSFFLWFLVLGTLLVLFYGPHHEALMGVLILGLLLAGLASIVQRWVTPVAEYTTFWTVIIFVVHALGLWRVLAILDGLVIFSGDPNAWATALLFNIGIFTPLMALSFALCACELKREDTETRKVFSMAFVWRALAIYALSVALLFYKTGGLIAYAGIVTFVLPAIAIALVSFCLAWFTYPWRSFVLFICWIPAVLTMVVLFAIAYPHFIGSYPYMPSKDTSDNSADCARLEELMQNGTSDISVDELRAMRVQYCSHWKSAR